MKDVDENEDKDENEDEGEDEDIPKRPQETSRGTQEAPLIYTNDVGFCSHA